MGVFSLKKYLEKIDGITEEEILVRFSTSDKNSLIITDFDSLIEYFKKGGKYGNEIFYCNYLYYICFCEFDKAKILLTKILNAFKIDVLDIDNKVHFIRENATSTLKRISDWKFSNIPLINNNNENKYLTKCISNFKYTNNWGRESRGSEHYLIHDENRQIIWIKDEINGPQFYFILDNNYYGIKLDHKFLTIYNEIDIISKIIKADENYSNLDDIIRDFDNEINECKRTKIDLRDHFPIGFFYRGPKWIREWDTIHPRGINQIRKLYFCNDLLTIEIENISYPHKGYTVLDVKNFNIIKAEKYQ